jgi:hypothetical protein
MSHGKVLKICFQLIPISYVTKKGNDWWTYMYKHQHLLPEMAMSGCGKMDLAKKLFHLKQELMADPRICRNEPNYGMTRCTFKFKSPLSCVKINMQQQQPTALLGCFQDISVVHLTLVCIANLPISNFISLLSSYLAYQYTETS